LKAPLSALGIDLNIAVGKIANPAGELQKFRLAVGPVSVANPLDPSLNSHVNVINHTVFLAVGFLAVGCPLRIVD
jgi:hypothetical protein